MRLAVKPKTSIKNILDEIKIVMSKMENPDGYELPSKYKVQSSPAKLMELMQTSCGQHSEKAMACELKVPMATLKAWKKQMETSHLLLGFKREVRRLDFSPFSKEECYFCKYNENDGSEQIAKKHGSPTFGLMQDISKTLVFNPWNPSEGHPEETLIKKLFLNAEKDCTDLTVVHLHQIYPHLLSIAENSAENVTSDS